MAHPQHTGRTTNDVGSCILYRSVCHPQASVNWWSVGSSNLLSNRKVFLPWSFYLGWGCVTICVSIKIFYPRPENRKLTFGVPEVRTQDPNPPFRLCSNTEIVNRSQGKTFIDLRQQVMTLLRNKGTRFLVKFSSISQCEPAQAECILDPHLLHEIQHESNPIRQSLEDQCERVVKNRKQETARTFFTPLTLISSLDLSEFPLVISFSVLPSI